MGLSAAAGFFQRVMELVLRDLIPKTALAYLDDIMAIAETPQVITQN